MIDSVNQMEKTMSVEDFNIKERVPIEVLFYPLCDPGSPTEYWRPQNKMEAFMFCPPESCVLPLNLACGSPSHWRDMQPFRYSFLSLLFDGHNLSEKTLTLQLDQR